MNSVRRLMHIEKSGPAFATREAFVDQALLSLQVQALTDAGHVLDAIGRKQLLDLMPAWNRLLKLSNATPSHQRRTCSRRDWFWDEARDAVVMALCYSETDSRAVKWAVADMLIRGEVVEAAQRAEHTLNEWMRAPDAEDGPETADMLRVNIAAYREFAAEGRL